MIAQVRTYNADKTKNMRMLNPADIDQLITVCGMVIRTSSLMPEMREGEYRLTLILVHNNLYLIAHIFRG